MKKSTEDVKVFASTTTTNARQTEPVSGKALSAGSWHLAITPQFVPTTTKATPLTEPVSGKALAAGSWHLAITPQFGNTTTKATHRPNL